ncbi:hypothetical protein, partial [Saccharicrinis sp. FJH54]|uniref:hypothetical protein n=1 Tax=Saccharicrinis sp. FJH54 TaxID=3344665 RepID=UPI0035D471B3
QLSLLSCQFLSRRKETATTAYRGNVRHKLKTKTTMTKSQRIILIISLTTITSIFVSSCFRHYFRIIGSGELKAYNSENTEIDTVYSIFRLDNVCEILYTENVNLGGMIQNSYATSIAEVPENNLIDSTFQITCSKDFLYNDSLIGANTDFSKIESLEVYVYNRFIEVWFNDEFMKNSNFKNDWFNFEITIKTCDDLLINNELKLYMNVKKASA